MTYPTAPLYPTRRSPVFARNVVATSHPLATEAGLVMLRQGGNAVDAAIASAITLTVVEPTGNGLGSDAFCILWDGNKLHGLNASGRSPAGWSPERFSGQTIMPTRGWESVTTPGAVSAWVELSNKFGKLPFNVLFGPAIHYARDGFHVTPVIAKQWKAGSEELRSQPGFSEAFMPGGRSPMAGEMFRLPDLANSLELIADTKGEAFYRGALSEKIEAFARQHGAVLNAKDLAEHAPDWCGTIDMTFGSSTLHEIPPNGQGIAALMALGILRHTSIADQRPDSVEALHLQIEAMKLAFADIHAYVADDMSMQEVSSSHLLDSSYLKRRAALIDRSKAVNYPTGAPKDGGTVCLSVGDVDGMMVSYIQSNYSGFGSGVVIPGTGISLQNRGHGFVTTPGHPNEVGPSKRPFHTIIPGFITRGGVPEMAFGLMGGPIQAQGHLQMMLRSQVWGQDPQTAADAPRWRVVAGLDVLLESSVDSATASDLAAKGHKIAREAPDTSFGFGGAQLVQRIEGGYVGGSDPRKDGCAGGF